MDTEIQEFYSSDGRGEMAVMNETGDTKTIWDSSNADEVEAARTQFDFFVKKKKYAAFTVGADGEKSAQIREFDPNLGKIIFVKPVVGG